MVDFPLEQGCRHVSGLSEVRTDARQRRPGVFAYHIVVYTYDGDIIRNLYPLYSAGRKNGFTESVARREQSARFRKALQPSGKPSYVLVVRTEIVSRNAAAVQSDGGGKSPPASSAPILVLPPEECEIPESEQEKFLRGDFTGPYRVESDARGGARQRDIGVLEIDDGSPSEFPCRNVRMFKAHSARVDDTSGRRPEFQEFAYRERGSVEIDDLDVEARSLHEVTYALYEGGTGAFGGCRGKHKDRFHRADCNMKVLPAQISLYYLRKTVFFVQLHVL